MTPWLDIDDVTVQFSRGWRAPRATAVDRVSLQVFPGEVVGLVGESGCGKSTLARACVGLVRPQSGSIRVCGRPVAGRAGSKHGPSPQSLQLLFQNVDAHLIPQWTPRQLLGETTRRFGHTTESGVAWLHRVGLQHRLDVPAGRLSGGERRRLGIARVLASGAPFVVADEPCAGIDGGQRQSLVAALVESRPPSGGLLLISHDIELMQKTCHRMVVMVGGRLVERTTTARLGKAAHHPYTDALLRASGLRAGWVPRLQADATSAGCPLSTTCAHASAACHTLPAAPALPENTLSCCHPVDAPPEAGVPIAGTGASVSQFTGISSPMESKC